MLAVFYGPSFSTWDHQIMGTGEDGAKNFYTLLYHISHDESPLWFDGMNYPHGEHVIYTDNQPLVANMLKGLNVVLPIDSNLHWLLPMLILLSYLLGGWCLWRLMLRTEIPSWFALLAAIGIMLLSPQLARMGGHYSLAYGCVIPVAFWLLQRARERPGRLRWAVLFLWVFFAAFLHPYFLAMSCFFLFWFFATDLLATKEWRNLRQWGKALIIAIGPMALFQLVMWLTDPVSDRPTDPYGFVHYRATWSSIFLPVEYSYYQRISSVGQPGMEGAFYIGLLAIMALLAGIPRLFRSRKGSESPPSATPFWRLFLWASIPLLLLATAFPFHIWKLDQLVDYLGPLKQFRGVGRFSFIFFYAVNLFAVIEIGRWVHHKSSPWKWGIGGVAVLVLFVEAYGLQRQVAAATGSGTDVFSQIGSDTTLDQLRVEDYQAILPLPFFHIGSENLRTANVGTIREHAFALSQETGLPLLATQMSRTSISQSLQAFQLVNEQYVQPELMLETGFGGKPLLLCVAQNQVISPSQADLINHAEPVSHHEGYDLFKLEVTVFSDIRQRNGQMLKTIDELYETAPDIYYSDSTYNSLHWSPFEDRSDQGYAGSSGAYVDRSEWNALIPEDYVFEHGRDYELSFWIHASQQNACNTQLWLWERNGDQEVRFELSEVSDHIAAVDGEWALVALPLSVQGLGGRLELSLHRTGRSININYDEVLIRPTDETFITQKDGRWGINNRYFAPDQAKPF